MESKPYKMLEAKKHVDLEAGCRYRYVYSDTEYFTNHNHDYYEVFMTIGDGIVHIINEKRQILADGSLVFIRPDDIHDYDCISGKTFSLVNISLTVGTIEELFAYLSDGFPSKALLSAPLPPTITLSQSEKARVLANFDELNAIKWQDKQQLKLKMRVLLVELFTKYFNQYSPEEQAFVPPWLELLCDQMKKPKNFTRGSVRMLELSRKSREYLARSMRKYYGVTVSEFINDLRINYITNMLQISNIPIIDLCFESGFQNVSWFYTLFKEKHGMTPDKFRSKHRR